MMTNLPLLPPPNNKNTSIPVSLQIAMLFAIANHRELLTGNVTENDVKKAIANLIQHETDQQQKTSETTGFHIQPEQPGTVERFLGEECIRVPESDRVLTTELFRQYKYYCKRRHVHPTDAQNFGKRLLAHWGVRKVRPWAEGKRPSYYSGVKWVGSKD